MTGEIRASEGSYTVRCRSRNHACSGEEQQSPPPPPCWSAAILLANDPKRAKSSITAGKPVGHGPLRAWPPAAPAGGISLVVSPVWRPDISAALIHSWRYRSRAVISTRWAQLPHKSSEDYKASWGGPFVRAGAPRNAARPSTNHVPERLVWPPTEWW